MVSRGKIAVRNSAEGDDREVVWDSMESPDAAGREMIRTDQAGKVTATSYHTVTGLAFLHHHTGWQASMVFL